MKKKLDLIEEAYKANKNLCNNRLFCKTKLNSFNRTHYKTFSSQKILYKNFQQQQQNIIFRILFYSTTYNNKRLPEKC